MDAIEIPLKISGIGRVNREINEVGKRLANLSQAGAMRLGGSGGMGSAAGRQSRPPAAIDRNKLMRQVTKFGADLQIARNRGYGGPATEAGLYSFQQQRRIQSSQPKSLLDRGKDAFLTARVGAGGLMPLVNKLMAISPAAVAATTGLSLVGKIAGDAAESLRAFRDSQITTGGTGTQTALLAALGIDPKLARSFGQRIATDPMAGGFAARAGIYNPGGEIFGDTNTATNLLKWVEALRKMSDIDARRAARITGSEDLLKYRYLSQDTMNQLGRDAAQTSRIRGPEQVRAAAEFEVQMGRLGTAFDDLKVQLADGFIPIVTGAVKVIADAVRWFNEVFGGNGVGAGKTDIFGNRYGSGNAKNPQIQALDANTASLRELAGILKDGIYGGGERARGAIPAGWTGQWYDKWSKNAIGLGAFEL